MPRRSVQPGAAEALEACADYCSVFSDIDDERSDARDERAELWRTANDLGVSYQKIADRCSCSFEWVKMEANRARGKAWAGGGG